MVLGVVATVASAKRRDDDDFAPKLDASTPLMALGYAAAGLAGIAVVGFKNSHRTHLD